MTKKRFIKLTRAYFTRLNEWAKANNEKPMNMGRLYRQLENLANNPMVDGEGRRWTRAEWWEHASKHLSTVFDIGVKS